MKQPIDKRELKQRVELSFNRFISDEYYRIGGVFSPSTYDWPGDKEGRALLAFASHVKMTGKVNPCRKYEYSLEKPVYAAFAAGWRINLGVARFMEAMSMNREG